MFADDYVHHKDASNHLTYLFNERHMLLNSRSFERGWKQHSRPKSDSEELVFRLIKGFPSPCGALRDIKHCL
jgi:hypothetical protein